MTFEHTLAAIILIIAGTAAVFLAVKYRRWKHDAFQAPPPDEAGFYDGRGTARKR